MIAILLLLSVGVAYGAAALWLHRRGLRAPPRSRYDAIVVAGCRVMPDGRPSAALARRVRHAVSLYEAGYGPRIVLTGGKGDPPPPLSEAEAAARLCRSLGVDPAALILEDRSCTTRQNATFAADLIGGSVLVVTDSYHAFRCGRVFGRAFDHADAVGVSPPLPARARLACREVAAVLHHGAIGRL